MQYKILMVDDDRELLKMLNQYFTLKNYTVMIAENGIEAMEKISANPRSEERRVGKECRSRWSPYH